MKRALLALTISLLALAASSSLASAQTLGTYQQAFGITAHDGWIAWAAIDAGGSYIVTRAPGAQSNVTTKVSTTRGDLNLGKGDSGGEVLVYSRCGSKTLCDLYRFDLITRIESKVEHASSKRRSEQYPSLHNGALAYFRICTRCKRKASQVVIADMAGDIQKTIPAPPESIPGEDDPVEVNALAFDGKRVGVLRTDGDFVSAARLINVKSAKVTRVMTVGMGEDGGWLLAPSFNDSQLYFARSGLVSQRAAYFRYSRKTGLQTAPAAEDLVGFAVDGANAISTELAPSVGSVAQINVVSEPLPTFKRTTKRYERR